MTVEIPQPITLPAIEAAGGQRTMQVVIPAAIGAGTNNWDPGAAVADGPRELFIIADTAAAADLSGISLAGGNKAGDTIHLLHNGSHRLTLEHNSSGSSEGSRFFLPEGGDRILEPTSQSRISFIMPTDAGHWHAMGGDRRLVFGRMQQVGNQSKAAGSWIKLTMDAAPTGVGGITDLSNSRFQVKKAGRYLLHATCYVPSSDASGSYIKGLAVYVNGGMVSQFVDRRVNSNYTDTTCMLCVPLNLAADATVELYIHQANSTSAAVNISAFYAELHELPEAV